MASNCFPSIESNVCAACVQKGYKRDQEGCGENVQGCQAALDVSGLPYGLKVQKGAVALL